MPEIEDLLRRYRPVGPRPELEARIFADPAARAWPWTAAAAALLLLTIGLQMATGRLAAREPASAGGSPSLEDLAALLGGGEDARRVAELLVLEEQARAAFALPPPDAQIPEPTP